MKTKTFIKILIIFILFIQLSGCHKEYQIKYNLNGGDSEEVLVDNFTKTDTITLPTLVKEGYIFIGWYMTPDFSGESITKIDGSIERDLELYAKFTEVTFQITYNLDGGSFIDTYPTTFTKGETVELVAPTKNGYQFIGWYTDSNFTDTTIINKIREYNQNITLYAKWEKLYTINFNLDNGYLEEGTSVQINNKEDYEIPTPTKEGYRFLGWVLSGSSFDEYITVIEKGFESDVYLKAVWQKVYSITYNVNDGIMPEDYIVEYVPAANEELPIPTKPGYDFKGWSFKIIPGTYTSIPISLEEDVTLTAIWTKSIYTVQYVLNDNDIFFSKDHLFVSFFTDFYNYIVDYKQEFDRLIASGVNNVEEFLAFCGNYTGGAAGMSQVGNLLSSYYLKQYVIKDIVDELPKYPKDNPNLYISIMKDQLQYQTADDGFIGYCLANGKYVEFIDFLVEFFFWWRIEEAYTGGVDDPQNTGSDFFASPWASIVDTAKFFYYDKDTLPKYFTADENIPYMYDRVPNVLKTKDIALSYEYDWELGLALPTNLEIEGYTFIGWFTTPDYLGEPITNISKNMYQDFIIYGKFEKNE